MRADPNYFCFSGRLSLWHFPSLNQLREAQEQGCVCVVSLQAPHEKTHLVKEYCEKLKLLWLSLDFWHEWHAEWNAAEGKVSIYHRHRPFDSLHE